MMNYQIPKWDQFPDLDLYMDQVVTYLETHLLKHDDETIITPAMVNNYVKQQIIKRPDKKKYNKEQLSQLYEIAILKQVLPIAEIPPLLSSLGDTPEEQYKVFAEELNRQILDVEKDFTPFDTVLSLVLKAYISIFKAKQILINNQKQE